MTHMARSRMQANSCRGVLGIGFSILWFVAGSACSNSSVNPTEATTLQQTTIDAISTMPPATTAPEEIQFESLTLSLLDGSTLEVTAPEGALGAGPTSHTVVSNGDVVLNVETGDRSFGTQWLTDVTDPQSEPYHGGELISGDLVGPRALIWIGPTHSLLLAYDSIAPEDARAVLDSLNIVEEAHGVVARGRLQMEQMTVTVPLRSGGALEIERAAGPDETEVIVERESGGAVTSIKVAYPTATAAVYIPPNRDGSAFIDLVELVTIEWLP